MNLLFAIAPAALAPRSAEPQLGAILRHLPAEQGLGAPATVRSPS